MRKLPASELIEDFDLYPRHKVDAAHVRCMVDSLEAKLELPPILIDKKSKRIVDGFHRRRAWMKHLGPDCDIPVIEMAFKNDGEMLMESAKRNFDHGRSLCLADRVRVLNLAKRFKLKVENVAHAVGLTTEKAKSLLQTRTAIGGTLETVPIKGTIRHMAGQTLTEPQERANEKLGGSQQMFYVNQLILLLENELIDYGNAPLIVRLRRLGELIDAAIADKIG